MPNSALLVTVAKFTSTLDAYNMMVRLRANGVKALLADDQRTWGDWFFPCAQGEVQVQVPEAQKATAIACLQNRVRVLRFEGDADCMPEAYVLEEPLVESVCQNKMAESQAKVPVLHDAVSSGSVTAEPKMPVFTRTSKTKKRVKFEDRVAAFQERLNNSVKVQPDFSRLPI